MPTRAYYEFLRTWTQQCPQEQWEERASLLGNGGFREDDGTQGCEVAPPVLKGGVPVLHTAPPALNAKMVLTRCSCGVSGEEDPGAVHLPSPSPSPLKWNNGTGPNKYSHGHHSQNFYPDGLVLGLEPNLWAAATSTETLTRSPGAPFGPAGPSLPVRP